MLASTSHLKADQASHQVPAPIVNAMTVDVEDYFQVQALSPHFPKSLWDRQSTRVERNTDRLLSMFADCWRQGDVLHSWLGGGATQITHPSNCRRRT